MHVLLAMCLALAGDTPGVRRPTPVRDGISGSTIRVHAGRSVDVPLPGPAQAICDDLSVARVEDGGKVLRVVGVHPGTTKCGFHAINAGQFRRVYDVQVLPP